MLVYFDSFAGLIPCKALARRERNGTEILIRVTADRPGWAKGGESWWTVRRIVPRTAVYKPRGAYSLRIRPYPLSTFDSLPIRSAQR